MELDHRCRADYTSESLAPKYALDSQEGLQVVPCESPLYPVAPPATATAPDSSEKWPCPAPRGRDGRRVPASWTLALALAVFVAAGVGGGVGGGLAALHQRCCTGYAVAPRAQTRDVLRVVVPALENCVVAFAEYNSAYRANLLNGTGVGGGYCVAVTIVKVDAGSCYLKNGTDTNDTMGRPDIYSSAVLLTNLDT